MSRRERKLAYDKVWREANREKMSLYKKKWELENREKRLAQMKTWRDTNHEKHLAQMKSWREANPTYRKVQYQSNREKELASQKSWRQANPIYSKLHYRNNLEKYFTNTRVRRERIKHISPIGPILNEKFEGSELHHTGVLDFETGKYYGVYVPASLNRGHCAQVGKERNLDRVNFDVIEFLVSGLDKPLLGVK